MSVIAIFAEVTTRYLCLASRLANGLANRLISWVGGYCLITLTLVAHAEPAVDKEQRIVSIDGALTEIIYALNAESTLVAVDTTSRYPEAVLALPQVGYMRQLSAEGILALHPTLVIASEDAGPEMVFEQLQAAGIDVERVAAVDSIAGAEARIRQLGVALGRTEKAEQLAHDVGTRSRAALDRYASQLSHAPATLFLLGAANRGLMAAGQETGAQALLDVLGLPNVMAHRGYKPISAEGAIEAEPQLVLVGHTGPADAAGVERMLAMTPAARLNRIHSIDVGKALGFGPRLPEVLESLLALSLSPPVSSGVRNSLVGEAQ